MAVFQGARLRNVTLPAEPAVPARSGAPTSVRRSSGVRPIGLLIAAILVATMLGLVYLTQTLGTNATTSEIGDLAAKDNQLRGYLRNQAWAVEVNTDAQDVAKRARGLKLKSLGDPLVLQVP